MYHFCQNSLVSQAQWHTPTDLCWGEVYLSNDALTCVRDMSRTRHSLIDVAFITSWYVSHESFIRVPWLIHLCAMTHSCVRHDSLLDGLPLEQRIHVCVRHVSNDSFICLPWLIHVQPLRSPLPPLPPSGALSQRRICTRRTARSLHEGRPWVCCLNSRPIDKYTYRWIETYTHIHKLQKSRTQIYIWAHRASSKATRLFFTK